MEDLYLEAKSAIDKARKILIISHRHPDADTLGAALSFKIWLEKEKKDITLACIDKPSKSFSFFPFINQFVQNFNLDEFELIIIVDVGASYMTDFHSKYTDLFDKKIPIINIDHHASNDHFGSINIVDTFAASTTLIIYRMLRFFNVEIDKEIATCLLAGIYGDTGSFMHSNTTEEVYEISAELMDRGGKIKEISKSLFNTNSIPTLKLWGKVLEKAKITDDKVVISVVREEDYENIDNNSEQLSGVVEYLNMVPGSKFAVLISEDRQGHVKGSFRTRSEGVDLSRIAGVFGGGGHAKASGFCVPGHLEEEVSYRIVGNDMSKKNLEF